jgi:hypothetical protein
VSRPVFAVALRLRALSTVAAALGMVAVLLAVGALFPAVGGSIGKLSLPKGVSELLGGADYGTLTGWLRSEIGAVYGPLVIAAIAITASAATTAGEEEDGVLALVLAHPVDRSRLVAAKAGAPYRFAVGGAVLRRDGRNLPGLDDSASTVRTALGIADGGKRLLLLALDGSAAYRSGLTVAEVAAELGRLGASDALGTDGGGSSALVARGAGGGAPVVRNHPSDGSERAVANGVGVFAVGG